MRQVLFLRTASNCALPFHPMEGNAILLLICFCKTVNSQIIRGFVMDQESNSKINFATVYFNGTHIGTNTDHDGFFKLDISDNISMPLTISALEYYSTTLNVYFTDTLNLIYLKPKVDELDKVVVTAKGDPGKRKSYLNLFRKEFLGISTNAINCEILNEDDIIFSYNIDS